MTEAERTQKFEDKHNEVLNELLGTKTFLVSHEIEHKEIDVNWNRGKQWMDSARFTDPMNNSTEGLREYRMQINNGGVITSCRSDLDLAGGAMAPIK